MLIGKTSTGEHINFDDSPFDTAYLIVPKLGVNWNLTGDMGTGNALTMQATGTANMSNQPDWEGSSHFNHSNAHAGQGNLIVLRDSNSAKMINVLYNAINPLGFNGQNKAATTVTNAKKMWFDVKYFNSASTDPQTKKPTVYAIAEGCFFNNPSALQVSNGSNNAQNTETWTYLATTVYKSEGAPTDDNQAGQPASQFGSIDMGPQPNV